MVKQQKLKMLKIKDFGTPEIPKEFLSVSELNQNKRGVYFG